MNAVAVSNKRQHAKRIWAFAAGCSAAAVAMASPAWANGPAISVGEPAGFADLTAQQTLLVDVYYGGVRRGETTIVATPDTVKLRNPAAVISLLPGLADRAIVEAALAAPALPANSGHACTPSSDRATCGRLAPQTVAVILDRDKLRLDVFLNPRLLALHDNFAQQYLPAPARGLSIINGIGAVLSGSTGPGKDFQYLQDDLVIADGARRIRAELSYGTGYGLAAERLALELDRPELRYSAGALWAPGNELSGRRKLLGFGVETQIDTRLDKDEILGSPLAVFLDHRARVDILRDGHLLASAIYEAGNQQLDTSNLPDGSYEVVVRVDEPGRQIREERRFFTKSRRLPSRGRTDFFGYGGVLVDGADSGSLKPSNHPYFQGGVARRLSESWAIEGQLQATDRGASVELAATLVTSLVQLRAAAIADLDGHRGAILQIASSATPRVNLNVDLRRIESHPFAGGVSSGQLVDAANADPFSASNWARSGESYSQAAGIVSYSLANIRFLGAFSYRHTKEQGASYSIGPSMQWDILRKGPVTLTLRGDMSATNRGTSEFGGISLQLLGRRTSLTASGGGRTSGIPNDELGDGASASVAGTWEGRAAGGELAIGAGYDHQPRQDQVRLSSQFDHPLASLAGDLTRSNSAGQSLLQYSLGLQSTVTSGAGAVRLAGKTTTESMILAHVLGARPDDRFEILVNEQVAGTIVGNRPFTLALPTYRLYDVRIRPTGKDLLAYDSSPRRIGLYPGAVTRLEWKAAPVVINFGRLVDIDGTPLAHASITGQGLWTETDDDGLFQIEAPVEAEVTVTTRSGASFGMTLPQGQRKGDIAQLGTVTCCGSAVVRLGALDAPRLASEEESSQ